MDIGTLHMYWGQACASEALEQIAAVLDVKAAALAGGGGTSVTDRLQHAICAREEVHHARPGTIIVTADDIFSPAGA
jgi:hypothetical protein